MPKILESSFLFSISECLFLFSEKFMNWTYFAGVPRQREVCLKIINKGSIGFPPCFQSEPIGYNQIFITLGDNFPFLLPHLLSSNTPVSKQLAERDLNNNTTLHVNGAFHPNITMLSVNIKG